MRVTKEAVAREARRSPATLYRLHDVVEAIDAAVATNPQPSQMPAAEARRRALVDEVTELKPRNALLVAENFRLMRLLAKHDPALDEAAPTDLAAIRESKRLTKLGNAPSA